MAPGVNEWLAYMKERALVKAGLAYEEVDLTASAAALAMVKGLGYQQAPVVRV